MKVTKVDNKFRIIVDKVSTGEVFQLGQYYYIKTPETVKKTGEVLAVNLQTGMLVPFNLNLECIIVECELMVK